MEKEHIMFFLILNLKVLVGGSGKKWENDIHLDKKLNSRCN